MTTYAPLNRLAAPQHGCWTRQQALASGVTDATIERQVARGVWRALHPGVYAGGAAPDTWLTRLWAGVLYLDAEDAVVARRSAARLWRLPGFDRSAAIDLLVTREHTPRLRGGTVKRTIHLPPHDVVIHTGLRTTSVTRTLHDLAAKTPYASLLTAAADGYRRGRTDPWRLLDSVRARPGLPGNRRLRAVIGELDARLAATRSVAEIIGQVRLRDLGYDGFDVNVRLTLSSGRRVEVDLLFAGRRVLEINGARYHGSVIQRRADAERRLDLEADGYRVRELWAGELHDDERVQAVVDDLLDTP